MILDLFGQFRIRLSPHVRFNIFIMVLKCCAYHVCGFVIISFETQVFTFFKIMLAWFLQSLDLPKYQVTLMRFKSSPWLHAHHDFISTPNYNTNSSMVKNYRVTLQTRGPTRYFCRRLTIWKTMPLCLQSTLSLYSVIGDFFMILRLFEDVVFK
jgi:hypothetical protein